MGQRTESPASKSGEDNAAFEADELKMKDDLTPEIDHIKKEERIRWLQAEDRRDRTAIKSSDNLKEKAYFILTQHYMKEHTARWESL